ncbi:hypothetical protein O6H91_03G001900 [Diphasiastrum complanatum]|uniref:Uncharacterized protein n=1 Tax=Diphasiastrum complanatum TaxID=34168 RepID=A0ACC2E384_DIPCM|nr:hypothetical protein O6H91_03G001900 [Diphasiastrum complanatum]
MSRRPSALFLIVSLLIRSVLLHSTDTSPLPQLLRTIEEQRLLSTIAASSSEDEPFFFCVLSMFEGLLPERHSLQVEDSLDEQTWF